MAKDTAGFWGLKRSRLATFCPAGMFCLFLHGWDIHHHSVALEGNSILRSPWSLSAYVVPSRVDWRLLNFWFLYSFLLPKSWEALTKMLSRCENWQRKKEKVVCFTYFAKMLLVFSPPFSLALRMDLLLNTNPFTVVCCLADAFARSFPLWWLGGLMACEPSKSWKLSQLRSWFGMVWSWISPFWQGCEHSSNSIGHWCCNCSIWGSWGYCCNWRHDGGWHTYHVQSDRSCSCSCMHVMMTPQIVFFFTVQLAGKDFVSSFLFAQLTVRMCCICLGRLCYWCWQKFALRVLLCTMQQKWHVLWYVPQVLDFMFTDSDC